MFGPRCLMCNRPLTNSRSVRRGYGPGCNARLHASFRAAMVGSARARLDRLAGGVDGLTNAQLTELDGLLDSAIGLLGNRPGVIA